MKGVYLSLKNQEVYRFCQEALNGKLTIKELSILVGKSYRQTQRLLIKVNIFCKKIRRKISLANSFNWDNELHIVDEKENYRFRSVNINTHIDNSISYDICGRPIAVKKASENIICLPAKAS